MAESELSIRISVAASDAISALEAVQKRIGTVADAAGAMANPNLDLTVTANVSAVDALQARIDALDGKELPLSVDADGASVDALQERLDGLDGQEVSVDVSSPGLEKLPGAAKRAESGLAALRAAAGKTGVAIGSLSRQVGMLVARGAAWGYDKIKAGFLAISAAVAAGTAAVVHFGVQQEQSRQRMQVMLGSVEQGNTLFRQLQEFANVTPFDTAEVVKAGQTLLTFGVAAGDVNNRLKMIGDASAATGKPLNDLATIYGQVMARGRADAERLNQLTEAGIPIVRMLADAQGTSAQGIYERAAAGKITAADVTAAFQAMTSSGGVFSGMMEKQSRTVGGLWSTLVGNIQTAAGMLGEQLAPVMRMVLDKAIEVVDAIGAMVEDGRMVQMFADWGRSGVVFFAELTKRCHDFYTFTIAAFRTIGAAVEMVWSGIKTGLLGIITAAVSAVEAAINQYLKIYNRLASALGKQEVSVNWKWTKALADTTAESARETRDAYRRWTDGGYFGQAMVDNEAFALDVDAWADRIDSAIGKGAEKVQQAIAAGNQETELAGAVQSEVADVIREAGDPGRTPDLRIVDSLTRIGMYNFGAAALNSLDVERNSLLREIVAQVSLRPSIVRI